MRWSDIKEIAREIDKKNFISEYLKWGERLYNSFQNSRELDKRYKSIVVVGMGGSGIVGDLIHDYVYLSGKNIEIHSFKGSLPPRRILRRSLLIGVSHSGNTIETINMLLNSYRESKETLVVTGGGRLEELAEKYHWKISIIEKALAPRAGLPQLLGSSFKAINPSLHLDNKIARVSKLLQKLAEKLSLESEGNEAFHVAKEIWGRIPIIYGDERFRGVLHRIKSSFNENSKINSYYATFPEGYHNEIEAYEAPFKDIYPIILRDKKDELEYLTKYFEEEKIDYLVYKMIGRDPLDKILTTIMYFDLVSIYLAYLRRIDPYEIKAINTIKEMRIK